MSTIFLIKLFFVSLRLKKKKICDRLYYVSLSVKCNSIVLKRLHGHGCIRRIDNYSIKRKVVY